MADEIGAATGNTEPPQDTGSPSFWDKLDILLKPIAGLATAAVVAYVGYLGSHILQERQQTNAKAQLYAQIMSSREASETGLRQQMFASIIDTFLQPDEAVPPTKLEQRILAVQLLTYNFHDALDLGPLFKYLERQVDTVHEPGTEQHADDRDELKRTASDVIGKQLAALESDGALKSGTFDLTKEERGKPGISHELPEPEATESEPSTDAWVWESEPLTAPGTDAPILEPVSLESRHFRVEVIGWNTELEEVRVRLQVRDPVTADVEFDEVFWVGWFDFPLIDNTRLVGGARCAVALNKFEKGRTFDGQPADGHVKLSLIYFHGSRSSLKSKTYYDEIIQEAIGR